MKKRILCNIAANDLTKTSGCDDPVLIRKLKHDEKSTPEEKKRIYNITVANGVFVSSHIAECDVNSRKYNKLDGSNFYVSPMSFPIEIDANLQHKDCPGGIQVRTSLLVKLHPGFSSFGEWVTRTVSDKITLSELTRLLQDKAYGLNLYLQKIIDGVNSFGLVSRYGKEAVAWTGQDEALPEWLEIKNIQYLDANALPTIAEQQRDAFNKKQQSLQQDIAERQQSLDYYIKVTEIDQAREEIAARNKILKEERERNITVAQQETQIEVMKNNLKLKELEARSKISDAQLARDIKMLELDIVEREEKLQSIRVARDNSTALNAAKIRKIDAEIIGMGPKATTIKTLIITGIVSIAAILVVLAIVYSVLRFVVFPSLPIAQECEKIKTRLSTYIALHYDYGKSSAALNELNSQFKSIQKFADHHIWVPGLEGKIADLRKNMDSFEKEWNFKHGRNNLLYVRKTKEIEQITVISTIKSHKNCEPIITKYIKETIGLKKDILTCLETFKYSQAIVLENKLKSRINSLIEINSFFTSTPDIEDYLFYLPEQTNNRLRAEFSSTDGKLSLATKNYFKQQIDKYNSNNQAIKNYMLGVSIALQQRNWNLLINLCERICVLYRKDCTKKEFIRIQRVKNLAFRNKRGFDKLEDVLSDCRQDLQLVADNVKKTTYYKLLSSITAENFNSYDIKKILLASAVVNNPSIIKYTTRNLKDVDLEKIFDERENNLLHVAAQYNSFDIAYVLINEFNFDVNCKNKNGNTALMIAAENCNLKIIEEIYKAGGLLDSKDMNGLTALYYAVCSNTSSNQFDVCKFLLSQGANPNLIVKIEDKQVPLYYFALLAHDYDMIKLFFDYKVDISLPFVCNDGCFYPLEAAILNPRVTLNTVELLIQRNCPTNGYHDSSLPPLFCALYSGNNQIGKFLLERGCDPNVNVNAAECSMPALFFALGTENFEMFNLLLKKGASPNSSITISGKNTPIIAVATMNVNNPIYAKVRGMFPTTVMTVTKNHLLIDKNLNKEFLKKLIEYGANIRQNDFEGNPAYLSCAILGWEIFQEIILPKLTKLEINWCNPEKNLISLLMTYSSAGNLDKVKKLLDHGADPNIFVHGGSALQLASKHGHKAVYELLLKYGGKEDDTCLLNLACAYLSGHGSYPKNEKKALEILEHLYRKENPNAASMLSSIHRGYLGSHIAVNTKKSSFYLKEYQKWLLKAAKKGVDVNAMLNYGSLCCKLKKYSEAYEYFDKVQKMGYPKAHLCLAKYYKELPSPNYKKALDHLNQYLNLIKGGNADEIYELGYMYEHGLGTLKNWHKAYLLYKEAYMSDKKSDKIKKAYNKLFSWYLKQKNEDVKLLEKNAVDFFRKKEYKKALENFSKIRPSENTLFLMGVCYQLLQQPKLSAEYYKKSLDIKSSPKVIISLAELILDSSEFGLNDIAHASHLLKFASVNLRNPEAMNSLGSFYAKGRLFECNGVSNYRKAAMWYETSAKLGFPLANYNLAQCYALGRLGKPDQVKAQYWFERGSNAGCDKSMTELASLTWKKGNIDKAEQLYLAAIQKGNVYACHNLAVLYAKTGKIKEAYRYYLKACNMGSYHAKSSLIAFALYEKYGIDMLKVKISSNEANYLLKNVLEQGLKNPFTTIPVVIKFSDSLSKGGAQ